MRNARTHLDSFIMQSCLLSPVGYEPKGDSVTAVAYSPDYSGSPFFTDEKVVNYTALKFPCCINNTDLKNVVIGSGCFLECVFFFGVALNSFCFFRFVMWFLLANSFGQWTMRNRSIQKLLPATFVFTSALPRVQISPAPRSLTGGGLVESYAFQAVEEPKRERNRPYLGRS